MDVAAVCVVCCERSLSLFIASGLFVAGFDPDRLIGGFEFYSVVGCVAVEREQV